MLFFYHNGLTTTKKKRRTNSATTNPNLIYLSELPFVTITIECFSYAPHVPNQRGLSY